MASNAGWNDQNGLAKPQNSGKPNAFKMRQEQLESNVLHQTDYSEHKPVSKKKVDMNNYGHTPDGPIGGSPAKRQNKEISSMNNNWLNHTDNKRQL